MNKKDIVLHLVVDSSTGFEGYKFYSDVNTTVDFRESESELENYKVSAVLAKAFIEAIGAVVEKKDRENKELFYQDVMGKMHEFNIIRKTDLGDNHEAIETE